MINLVLASEKPNGYFLPGSIDEFWWGTIAFTLLLAVFVWKGLPALSRLMKARTEAIRAEIEAAEAARAEAEAELEEVRRRLSDAAAESERIVAEARERAARLEADLLERARAEIAETKERARIEIEASKAQALADLRAEIAAQAARAADAVVRANLDDSAQHDLIADYIASVGAR